jgi:hypothetical protein
VIEDFPEEWPRVPLREIAAIQTGPSNLTPSLLPPGEHGVPVLSPTEISWFSVASEATRAIAPQAAARLHRYQVRAGDVVCVRTGDLVLQPCFVICSVDACLTS